MTSKYFCAYHLELMSKSEPEALRNWGSMMHQGVKSYSECRFDTAQTFFKAALDIAFFRSDCAKNTFFNGSFLTKPVEFLIHIFVGDLRFQEALSLLSKLTAISNSQQRRSLHDRTLVEFIAKQYEILDNEEKRHMTTLDSLGREKALGNDVIQVTSFAVH